MLREPVGCTVFLEMEHHDDGGAYDLQQLMGKMETQTKTNEYSTTLVKIANNTKYCSLEML